ncbi:MAG TPA: HlyC/CorC family transporter [Pseudomonadales bacterium]|nr:HlyC/CorC family transporter [Pseudomonadales bacterium]
MEDTSLGLLIGVLTALTLLGAFFSGAETGIVSLNRYKLRHLIKKNHRAAKLVDQLLSRPDRFFGIVLIGNNLANAATAAIAAIVVQRMYGSTGAAIATFVMTLVTIVFAEIIPKMLGSLYPERIAFPASYVLFPLLKALYPLVWLTNVVSNGFLRLFGINPEKATSDQLSPDELRTVVRESGKMISPRYRGMLLNILDLGQMTVQDIMVPRTQVNGINIDQSDADIIVLLRTTEYTRIPVYQGEINNILGILHMRRIGRLVDDESNERDVRDFILSNMREPYFVPETTPLNMQLLNFQKEKRRMGLVVDEYGDVQGVVTLEDILEEIVGEFTTNLGESDSEYERLPDNRVRIDCSVNIRDINRHLNWQLPVNANSARTLNGLFINHIGAIPANNVCFTIGAYCFETEVIADNKIQRVIAFERKKIS